MKYMSRTVAYGYSLEVRNDSAMICLPYMGDVHTPTYDNDGLNFSHLYKGMNSKLRTKGKATEVRFSISHGIINYKIKVIAYGNGTADIMVAPSNAQSCSYSGWWK